jgi:hypothetical protein
MWTAVYGLCGLHEDGMEKTGKEIPQDGGGEMGLLWNRDWEET